MTAAEPAPEVLSPTASERRQRSRAACIGAFPHLAGLLAAEPVVSKPVISAGEIVNVDIGSGLLYREDAPLAAARQLDKYLDKPFRFFVNDLTGANLGSAISRRMVSAMYRAVKAMDKAEALEMPSHDGALLFVLGLGLGCHLPRLIAGTKARHIVIVEPYAEFVAHSLAAVDWQALLAEAAAEGRTVHLICERDVNAVMRDITRIVYDVGVPMIDGSFVFLHYPAWELQAVQQRLWQFVDRAFISKGYFEDELIMLGNAFENLRRGDFWLLDATPRLMRPEPVMIVGSGPSVDAALPHIKRLHDRCVVFTCGSALRVCLRNGIVPDFHCELENGEGNYDLLKLVADEFSFKSITLAGSLTVHPKLLTLFGEHFLFFRDSVTPTRALAEPGKQLRGAAPTVANTALATAAAMGFTQFYLFGVDCGQRQGEQAKHSQHSPYGYAKEWKKQDDETPFPLELPGNFGGVVKTYWVLDLSCSLLGDVTRVRRLKVVNASNGARIPHTVPRMPQSVQIASSPVDRARTKAAIRAQLRRYGPGEYLRSHGFGTVADGARRLFRDIYSMLDEIEREGCTLVEIHQRFTRFFENAGPTYDETSHLFYASAIVLPKIAMFVAHRLRRPEDRERLRAAFLAECREIFRQMESEGVALYDRLAEASRELAACAAG
jgi:hypothetical protein